MLIYSFSFNGVKKENIFCEDDGHQHSAFAPVFRKLITILGLPGAHVMNTDTQVRVIRQQIFFSGENIIDLRKIEEELAEWLITNEPVPLIFDHEPDRIYFAMVDGDLDIREFLNVGEGTITFLCPDPYKYGPEKTDIVQDTAIIENKGTADADPVFTLNILQPTTYAMISNGDEYMMIGRPADVEDVPTDTQPLILNDNASTLVGWSNFVGGYNFFGMGLVGGGMEVYGGYAFRPATYGSNPNGWTGPAIRKSLSEPLQDFEIEMDIAMLNASRGVGRITVVGLDANDAPVFTMQMMDPTDSYPNNRANYKLGTDDWFSYQGDEGKNVWNDGRFLLRITRQGQEFTARIARKLDPNGYEQTGRHNRKFTDTRNEYQNKVTQIAIYMARARSFTHVGMLFHNLTVRKLIDPSDLQVPYIAQPDDEIIFDHKTGDCYINGDPVPFDFGADFFKLKKGENVLVVSPENTFETELKYRERYL